MRFPHLNKLQCPPPHFPSQKIKWILIPLIFSMKLKALLAATPKPILNLSLSYHLHCCQAYPKRCHRWLRLPESSLCWRSLHYWRLSAQHWRENPHSLLWLSCISRSGPRSILYLVLSLAILAFFNLWKLETCSWQVGLTIPTSLHGWLLCPCRSPVIGIFLGTHPGIIT